MSETFAKGASAGASGAAAEASAGASGENRVRAYAVPWASDLGLAHCASTAAVACIGFANMPATSDGPAFSAVSPSTQPQEDDEDDDNAAEINSATLEIVTKMVREGAITAEAAKRHAMTLKSVKVRHVVVVGSAFYKKVQWPGVVALIETTCVCMCVCVCGGGGSLDRSGKREMPSESFS